MELVNPLIFFSIDPLRARLKQYLVARVEQDGSNGGGGQIRDNRGTLFKIGFPALSDRSSSFPSIKKFDIDDSIVSTIVKIQLLNPRCVVLE